MPVQGAHRGAANEGRGRSRLTASRWRARPSTGVGPSAAFGRDEPHDVGCDHGSRRPGVDLSRGRPGFEPPAHRCGDVRVCVGGISAAGSSASRSATRSSLRTQRSSTSRLDVWVATARDRVAPSAPGERGVDDDAGALTQHECRLVEQVRVRGIRVRGGVQTLLVGGSRRRGSARARRAACAARRSGAPASRVMRRLPSRACSCRCRGGRR